jgi:hypothetical protein
MISDHEAEYQESLRLLSRDRRYLTDELSRVPGLTVFPSQANFVLVKLPVGWHGVELRDYLISRHGVYIRECGNKLGMSSQFVRLVVRPQDDVARLVDGMLAYGRYLHGGTELDDNSADLIMHPASSRSTITHIPTQSYGGLAVAR